MDQRVTSVRAARAWKDPHACTGQRVRLRADHCVWVVKRDAIGADSEHSHPPRPIPPHPSSESAPAIDELRRRYVASRRRGAPYESADPITQLKKPMAFVRCQQTLRESGLMQRRPESVAGSSEVRFAAAE